MAERHRFPPSEVLLVAVAVGSATSAPGCAAEGAGTHVFVRDPRQVWVEVASTNGEQVALPPGEGLRGVSVRPVDPLSGEAVSYTGLVREVGGGITVDDRRCAPWPTTPLLGSGELRILKRAGEAPFTSDGATLRIAYLCDGLPRDSRRTSEVDFVTPWTNVREVRIVRGETDAAESPPSSNHPALQHEAWHE